MSLLSTLSPEQTKLLYDQAGFLLLQDLPEGSQISIDGIFNTPSSLFSGYKLLPPTTLHLVTFTPPAPSSSPVPLPRTAFLFFSLPNQTLLRTFSSSSECLVGPSTPTVVSKDHLKTLDPTLAPYPFDSWEAWRALLPPTLVNERFVAAVLGERTKEAGGWDLDGLEIGEGEEEDGAGAETLAGERVLRNRARKEREEKEAKESASVTELKEEDGSSKGPKDVLVKGTKQGWVQFDVRRSWRRGAEGEEVSLFARDKSWLFWDVVESQCGGDPTHLLTQLSLLLPLSILLQAPSLLLQTHRRILTLISLSHTHLLPPPPETPGTTSIHPFTPEQQALLPAFYVQLLDLLTAQVSWLAEDFFASELPEAEAAFEAGLKGLGEGLALRRSLGGEDGGKAWKGVEGKWEALRELVGGKFGWVVGGGEDGDEGAESEEDEEDRPQVVEGVDIGYEIETL